MQIYVSSDALEVFRTLNPSQSECFRERHSYDLWKNYGSQFIEIADKFNPGIYYRNIGLEEGETLEKLMIAQNVSAINPMCVIRVDNETKKIVPKVISILKNANYYVVTEEKGRFNSEAFVSDISLTLKG